MHLEPSLYQKFARNNKSQKPTQLYARGRNFFSDPISETRETMLLVELDDNH